LFTERLLQRVNHHYSGIASSSRHEQIESSDRNAAMHLSSNRIALGIHKSNEILNQWINCEPF
jgi:hypothetical protein